MVTEYSVGARVRLRGLHVPCDGQSSPGAVEGKRASVDFDRSPNKRELKNEWFKSKDYFTSIRRNREHGRWLFVLIFSWLKKLPTCVVPSSFDPSWNYVDILNYVLIRERRSIIRLMTLNRMAMIDVGNPINYHRELWSIQSFEIVWSITILIDNSIGELTANQIIFLKCLSSFSPSLIVQLISKWGFDCDR